jgi:heavy metal translocating P-type ATPase
MLVNVGILIFSYVGVKIVDKYRQKTQLTTEELDEKIRQEKNFFINDAEKKGDHYLKVTTLAIGVSAVRNVYPPLSVPLHFLSVGLITYIVIPPLKRAEKLIRQGQFGNDLLISTSAFLCLGTNKLLTISLGYWFYHLGSKLIAKTQKHSKKMLTSIFEEQPRTVWLLKDNIELEVPLETLHINDIIVVNTGEVVPIDGTIRLGTATIDQHALTGESQPAEKGIGDEVFAATIVITGKIYVKVEKTGKETTVSKISQMLNNAVVKSDTQTIGENWADQIAFPIFCLSTVALMRIGSLGAIAVVNSGFGTNVRMVTPLGVLKHINLATQKGILIKDGRALEKLNEVDTIVFDKTGTLTKEEPEIARIIVCEGYNEDNVLLYAATAENKLTHPIAKTILNKAIESKLTLPDIDASQYKMGYGVTVSFDEKVIRVGSIRFMTAEGIPIPEKIEEAIMISHAEGHSLVIVALNHEVIGAIEMQASVRQEVKEMLKHLRALDIQHLSIVSGDHKQPTKKLAESLGMDSYFYEILPENKAQIVEQLQQEGKVVCFIGDGINDAIAMKKADVSISIKGASSIATDIAPIVLMDNGLSHLSQLFEISKSLDKTLRNSLKIAMTPGVITIAGVFLLNFGRIHGILLDAVGLIIGIANARGYLKMPQLSKVEKKSINYTSHN